MLYVSITNFTNIWYISNSFLINIFGGFFRTLQGYVMPALQFSLQLERKYSYYLLNMILPVIFLAFLGAFVFLLPVESGEKNGFALTILLSLSVVMTIVSKSIPPTSTSICVLSKLHGIPFQFGNFGDFNHDIFAKVKNCHNAVT